jgi:hypothetical protein
MLLPEADRGSGTPFTSPEQAERRATRTTARHSCITIDFILLENDYTRLARFDFHNTFHLSQIKSTYDHLKDVGQ